MSGKGKNSKKILHSLGIGENLRKIRNDYNLTLDEVSEATEIATETIRRLEKNQFEPKLSTLEVLSDYYRVDLIELLARKRRNTRIFSENLIKRINDFLNQQDFDGLKVYTNSLLNSSDFDLISLNINLKSFFYALNYIKYDPINGQNDNISILEDILVNMTPSSKKKKSKYVSISIRNKY